MKEDNMKHKYAEFIKAYADDPSIRFKSMHLDLRCGEQIASFSVFVSNMDLYDDWQIYQEPEIEVKYFRKLTMGEMLIGYSEVTYLVEWDLKITYQDGEPIKFETPKKD